jgi:ribosomal protein L37AE/L43A
MVGCVSLPVGGVCPKCQSARFSRVVGNLFKCGDCGKTFRLVEVPA